VRALYFYWLPTLAYMGLLFWLSSSPHPPTLAPFPYSDKLGHALAYCLLGALLWRALRGTTRGTWRARAPLMSVILGVIYGALIELYQSTLGYRSCEWGDALANAMGVTTGVVICQRWARYHFQPKLRSKL
jgi:VanZ family protein